MTRARPAAVVFIALLVVAAVPANVGATGHLVVGSQHTTKSDFEAGTLDNMTVEGSGEPARVVLADKLYSYNPDGR